MTAVAPSMFIGIGRRPSAPAAAARCLRRCARSGRERRRPARLRHEREQAHRARIDAVPAVAEAGDDLAVRAAMKRSSSAATTASLASPSPALRVDCGEQLHALLAGAAVDVVERVDRRGHRAVQRQAAGDGHARDRDRRRMRTVVDGGDQRRLEQRAPAPAPAPRRAASARSSRESAGCRSAPGSDSRAPRSCRARCR